MGATTAEREGRRGKDGGQDVVFFRGVPPRLASVFFVACPDGVPGAARKRGISSADLVGLPLAAGDNKRYLSWINIFSAYGEVSSWLN